jgi:hypothetical protein
VSFKRLTVSLTEGAKPLFKHVLGIKEIDQTFEDIAPLFEEYSKKEGTSPLIYRPNLKLLSVMTVSKRRCSEAG